MEGDRIAIYMQDYNVVIDEGQRGSALPAVDAIATLTEIKYDQHITSTHEFIQELEKNSYGF